MNCWAESPEPLQTDEQNLVSRCLSGDQNAWVRLVESYESLVYAIIRRTGVANGEESDLFQAVWIDIYRELPRLRDPTALRPWISAITRHKCYHWRRRAARRTLHDWDPELELILEDPCPRVDESLEDLDRRQQVRETIRSMPPRCQQLFDLLFLTEEPLPYAEVAQQLGLAEGSISYLRSSCIDRLRRLLRKRGLT